MTCQLAGFTHRQDCTCRARELAGRHQCWDRDAALDLLVECGWTVDEVATAAQVTPEAIYSFLRHTELVALARKFGLAKARRIQRALRRSTWTNERLRRLLSTPAAVSSVH